MKLSQLKPVRVFVSLLFLFLTFLLFTDIGNHYVVNSKDYIIFLQFIPSLISFLSAAGIASIGFLIILLITVLFGRVYCSSVCPIGILQDIIIKISNRKKKRYKFDFAPAHNVYRYSFLGIAVLLFIAGSFVVVNLLDPFSNFGRIATNLFRPVIIFGNNILSAVLEMFNNFSVYPVELKNVTLFSFVFSCIVTVIILIMSWRHGRLFCNSICPVGTLLGLISKASLFRISIDDINCSKCGVCENVCKSNCIDSENESIDFSRCVACYNCLQVCPTEAVVFESSLKIRNETESTSVDQTKRNFLMQTAFFTLGLTALNKAQQKIEVYVKNKFIVNRLHPISPPGSKSISDFNDLCTACQLCVSACPTQVLQPSFLEYGFTGMLQPRLDNLKGFCNYDCTVCGDVCPTGAIVELFPAEKKLIQIGKANFIKENCVVETQKTNCGACAEHCPTKAVHMVPYENNLKIPETNDEICIGCGACEYACPTIPYKAIYVEGNRIHQTAQLPKAEKLEEEVDYKEEFPF